MTREERIKLIGQLEKARGSKVIVYITSTRPNLSVQMAIDVIRPIYDHLVSTQVKEKGPVDLLLHSDGGESVVPWRLVTLIREFTDHFSVLVPHRAFSAATLTALGADEIVMHPMGMLGPIDPSVTGPFNPVVQSNPTQSIPISVEDVSAYVALVKEDVGIRHEDELVQAFAILANNVHPLALGSVKRSQSQGRMMARKLLQLHMDTTDEHRMNEIAENLSSRLYYHGHPINRREAKNELDLKVTEPDVAVEKLMWELYEQYETEMRLTEPFNPVAEFLAGQPGPPAQLVAQQVAGPAGVQILGQVPGAVQSADHQLVWIESTPMTDRRTGDIELRGSYQANGQLLVVTNFLRESWVRDTGEA